MNNSYITIIKEKRTALSRKRVPLNQNECTDDFRIGVPFEQNLQSGITGAYDAAMKKLLSNKEILVPILQMTIPEYEGYTQEEILSCLDIDSITGEDFVSDIPADLRLHKEESELSSVTEKLIRFDIRFKARNPKLSTEKLKVSLHMDLEAQRSYRPKNPSYPVIKRAVYYVARDLSSQLGSITGTTDYSKLEKC